MPFKILLVIFVLAVPLIPTFWAILDIPKRRFSSTRAKAIWFAVVATLPFIGAVLYILIERRKTQPASTADSASQGKEEIRTDA